MPLAQIKFDVELNDGSLHHIVVLNPSLVAWDRTRNLRGWPDVGDAKFLWMTFLAWHHMKAAGLVDCEFDAFEKEICAGIGDTESEEETADGEPAEPELVDPTPPNLAAVSASP